MKPVQLGALGTGHLPPAQCSHKESPGASARSDTAANVYCGLETPCCLHNLRREEFLIRAGSRITFQHSSPHKKKKKKKSPLWLPRFMSLHFNQAHDPSTIRPHSPDPNARMHTLSLNSPCPNRQALPSPLSPDSQSSSEHLQLRTGIGTLLSGECTRTVCPIQPL